MFNLGSEDGKNPKQSSFMGIFLVVKALFRHDKLGELLLITGFISRKDLQLALYQQKQSGLALGQVLIELQLISKRQLGFILTTQRTIRVCAALTVFIMSFDGLVKKAHAGEIKDLPGRYMVISAAQATADFGSLEENNAGLFGSDEKRSGDLTAFTKWSGMFEKFEKLMSSESAQKIIKDMQAELVDYKSISIRKMAEQVNLMMNRQKYILDNKNWGKSDYWATPVEFMMRGGDCEDFAIAKYFALRALGVPENRLRVAIVHDLKKNIPHAVLVVYAEQSLLILDNQSKVVLNDTSISHYKPIFSINRQAWWLHTVPEETVVASAAQ